jgi:hypothetical protein
MYALGLGLSTAGPAAYHPLFEGSYVLRPPMSCRGSTKITRSTKIGIDWDGPAAVS